MSGLSAVDWGLIGTASLVGSLLASVAGVAMIPGLVRRLPTGWFARPPIGLGARFRAAPGRVIAQNTLGFVLIALGVALLFLPGQGLLTILLGVLLTDLPVRRRLLRWLASRPLLAEKLQQMRRDRGLAPFEGLPGS